MDDAQKELLETLMFFSNFIGKSSVMRRLRGMSRFPDFNDLYSKIRLEETDFYKKDDSTYLTCKTLVLGIEEGKISEDDLDELLFSTLEESLFNAYLFNFNSENIPQGKNEIINLLSMWKIPEQTQILKNVSQENQGLELIPVGHRTLPNEDGSIGSIIVLLIDKELVKVSKKNQEDHYSVFPTLIEFDFKRKLVHIRIKDVDNIASEFEEVRTMKGRIERTLEFISHLKPAVEISNFENFRDSLFSIEEDVLKNKRKAAEKKLNTTFSKEMNTFIELANKAFNPPERKGVPWHEYIRHALLCIVSTTIQQNTLGDIVSIRFRNSDSDKKSKYAEVYIKDNDYSCISSNDIYWVNLPILLNEKKIEFLKIGKTFSTGFAIANLEYSLETANIRLLRKSSHPDKELDKNPTDTKYSDFIDFLLPYLLR